MEMKLPEEAKEYIDPFLRFRVVEGGPDPLLDPVTDPEMDPDTDIINLNYY